MMKLRHLPLLLLGLSPFATSAQKSTAGKAATLTYQQTSDSVHVYEDRYNALQIQEQRTEEALKLAEKNHSDALRRRDEMEEGFGKMSDKEENQLRDFFITVVKPAAAMEKLLSEQLRQIREQSNNLWEKKNEFFHLQLQLDRERAAKSQKKHDNWEKNIKN